MQAHTGQGQPLQAGGQPHMNLSRSIQQGSNTTAGRMLNSTNGTMPGYIDVEADEIAPGYAVLLMYMMLFMLMGAQTGLVIWRKQHKRSYDLVSLGGLWVMPAIIGTTLKFWRFLVVWAIYSIITGYLMSLCSHKKMARSTPRMVYAWFLGTYKLSVFVGMTGYFLLVLDMFGVGLLLARYVEPGLSLVLLWYGLYFGILGRDLAEVSSEQMGNAIGVGRGERLTSTVNACGICGDELKDMSHLGQESAAEPVRQLACKHSFHELCIRGWTIVGKKDVCPVCLEKVDMRDLYADKPWETQNLSWIQMLDTIRYMVVWFPIIFLLVSLLAKMFPHHHVTRHVAVATAGRFGQSPASAYSRAAVPPPMPLDTVDVGAIAAGAR